MNMHKIVLICIGLCIPMTLHGAKFEINNNAGEPIKVWFCKRSQFLCFVSWAKLKEYILPAGESQTIETDPDYMLSAQLTSTGNVTALLNKYYDQTDEVIKVNVSTVGAGMSKEIKMTKAK